MLRLERLELAGIMQDIVAATGLLASPNGHIDFVCRPMKALLDRNVDERKVCLSFLDVRSSHTLRVGLA